MVTPRTATLPGAYLRELVELCRRFALEPADLLAGTGLSYEALGHPAVRVDLATFERAVGRATDLTREPGLALLLGRQMRLSWHGFLGFAAMTAGNLREALDLAERYARTRTDALTLVTRVWGDQAAIVLEEHVPLGGLREFLVTALFFGIATIGRSLTGAAVDGAVEFAHAEPACFGRFLAAVPELGKVRFGQRENRIVFPAEALSRPILTADPVAAALAREQCERELSALGEGARLAVRVRALVRERRFPAIAAAAKELAVSERTLKRRLAELGTSYSEIVDEARQHEALHLLAEARLSADEIAERLGYFDRANFARAFKRWTGRTPYSSSSS
jgi:AraC-like DNA-binding protein